VEDRQRLKEEFFEEAGKRFEEMFTENTLDELVTFRQKEDRACEVVDNLWEWLMEKHIQLDESRDVSGEENICPECRQVIKRRGAEGGKEDREVVGKRGTVEFERGGCECKRCRKVFFPSGPADGNRNRRL
jgi:uncharacterized protein with PIN domain